ncbi:MAG TPA: AzlD domain-containing protein [bacterium]|jgi:branched-subunit amino acid transport protein|nr:AzlD domain-containing protein [bacterium]
MSLLLILALGAMTYGSRAAALVLMPPPPGWLRGILERIPAPLFAGLAVLPLVSADGTLRASTPILAAFVASLLSVPFRSLLLTLAAGLIGYAVGGILGR